MKNPKKLNAALRTNVSRVKFLILKTLQYSTVMNIVVLLDIETLILFAGGLIE